MLRPTDRRLRVAGLRRRIRRREPLGGCGRPLYGPWSPSLSEEGPGRAPIDPSVMTAGPIGFTLIIRVETPNHPGAFGELASAIGDAGGVVGAVDVRSVSKAIVVRDVTVT